MGVEVTALSTNSSSFELSDRDHAVLVMVARLSQVSSSHLKALLFDDVSRVSLDRSLKRLVAGKYLAKVGKRASQARGGTAPAVYRLGPKGHWLLGLQGRFRSTVNVNAHTLVIADLFTALVQLDRLGAIKLLAEVSVEHGVGHSRADLFVDYALPALGKRRRYYIEVQMSARPDVIRRKVEAYWDAYNSSRMAVFPFVAFVVLDEWHASEIGRLLPERSRELFQVHMIDDFMNRELLA